jgi:hypothetical protein
MFNALSSAEVDGQQVELLPDRTVMSAFSSLGGFHQLDLGNGGDHNDGGDANGGDANGGDGGHDNWNFFGKQDNSGGDGGYGGDGGTGGAGGGNGGFNKD